MEEIFTLTTKDTICTLFAVTTVEITHTFAFPSAPRTHIVKKGIFKHLEEITKQDFLQQYHFLLPKGRLTEDHEIKDCLAHIGLDPDHYQVGRSKVFMREAQYRLLKERLHAKFDDSAFVIQKWFRLQMTRRDFLRMKRSALLIQSFWRGYIVRKDFEVLRSRNRAALRIQYAWKAYQQRVVDAKQKAAAVVIQRNAKTFIAKKRYLKLKEDKLHEELRRQEEEKALKDVRDKAEALVEDALSKTIFNDNERPYEEQLKTDFNNVGDKTDADKESEELPKKNFSHHIYEQVHKPRTDSTISAASSGSSGNEQVPDGSESDGEKREEAKSKGRSLLRRLSFKEKKGQKAAARTKSADTRSLDDYVVVIPVPGGTDMTSPGDASKKKSLLRALITKGKKGNSGPRSQSEKGSKGLASLIGSPLSSGGREWTPTDKFIVNGGEDIEILSQFLSKKVCDMNRSERAKKDTVVDVVFKKALQQYHANVLTTYASTQQRKEIIKLKYDDMTATFEMILKKTIDSDKRGADFPMVIGIHAFNGVVDEFVKYRQQHLRRSSLKRPRKESRKEKKRTTELYHHNGHIFTFTAFNIATFCEHCNALIWDRGLVCQGCNFTCHKKCFQKLPGTCKGRKPSATGPHSLFGTDLAEQVTLEEPIPFAVIMLMKEIEDRGLLSEGLYRKPGLQASIKSLKNLLSTKPPDEVDLHEYGIHVIASVIKLFFRQLPRPLIPDEFYNEVLRSCDLENETEIHASLYDVVQKFPKANRELFEMIIIHLARVALNEACNKMSPNGLSIIWAPCVMRPPPDIDAMEGLRQLPHQTLCMETLIKVQLEKIQQILSEHDVLGEAMETAENRMKQILGVNRLDDRPDGNNEGDNNSEEFRLIQEQINSMEEERERLTSDLASMEPRLTRGLTMDSDDGLTSDDALTDNEQRLVPDDIKSMSKKLSASSSDISPSRPKRRKPAKQMRRWFSEKTLNDDSSFEDLSGEGNDDLYIIP